MTRDNALQIIYKFCVAPALNKRYFVSGLFEGGHSGEAEKRQWREYQEIIEAWKVVRADQLSLGLEDD